MINSIYYYSSIQFPHYAHHTYPSITPTFILIASPFIYWHNTSLLPTCQSFGTLPLSQHTFINLTSQLHKTPPPAFIISPIIPSLPAAFPFFSFLIAPSTSFNIILPLPSSMFPTPLSSSSHSPSTKALSSLPSFNNLLK